MMLVEGFVFIQENVDPFVRKLFVIHLGIILFIFGPIGRLSFNWSIVLRNIIQKELGGVRRGNTKIGKKEKPRFRVITHKPKDDVDYLWGKAEMDTVDDFS